MGRGIWSKSVASQERFGKLQKPNMILPLMILPLRAGAATEPEEAESCVAKSWNGVILQSPPEVGLAVDVSTCPARVSAFAAAQLQLGHLLPLLSSTGRSQSESRRSAARASVEWDPLIG